MQESNEMTAEEARKALLQGGKIYYHGTSTGAADVIFREGLIPKKGIGIDSLARVLASMARSIPCDFLGRFGAPHTSFVSLAPRPEFSVGYAQFTAALAGGHPVILRVKIPISFDRKVTPFDPYEFRVEGAIPPEWLSIFSKPPALRQNGLRLAETSWCRVTALEIFLFPFLNDGLDPELERRAVGYLRALREQGIIKLSDSELELFFLAGPKFRQEMLKASSSAMSVDHEGLA
jgi:hypothetical protein